MSAREVIRASCPGCGAPELERDTDTEYLCSKCGYSVGADHAASLLYHAAAVARLEERLAEAERQANHRFDTIGRMAGERADLTVRYAAALAAKDERIKELEELAQRMERDYLLVALGWGNVTGGTQDEYDAAMARLAALESRCLHPAAREGGE